MTGVVVLANVALPSFLPHSFATALGIFLIAAVEANFLAKMLGLSYGESYRHSMAANWRSTIAGIPLAWLVWLLGVGPIVAGVSALGFEAHPLVGIATVQTFMTGGMQMTEWSEVGSAIAWMVTLVPYWLGSVWIERRTLWKRLPDLDRREVSRAVVRGNLVTYAGFLLLATVVLVDAIRGVPELREDVDAIEKFDERLLESGSDGGSGRALDVMVEPDVTETKEDE